MVTSNTFNNWSAERLPSKPLCAPIDGKSSIKSRRQKRIQASKVTAKNLCIEMYETTCETVGDTIDIGFQIGFGFEDGQQN